MPSRPPSGRSSFCDNDFNSRKNRADKIAAILNSRTILTNGTVLDVGTGSGQIAHEFARYDPSKNRNLIKWNYTLTFYEVLNILIEEETKSLDKEHTQRPA